MILRFLILLCILSSQATAQKKYDAICWSGTKCLNVGDFKGKNISDSISSIIGKKHDAMSSMLIGHQMVSHDTINTYRLIGYFERELSWINADGSLLSHEQTHFNIQQLMICRTNKLLDSIFFNTGTKINYDSLIDIALIKLDSLDSAFDAETWHGAIQVRNEKWVNNIMLQVEELEEHGIECK